MLTTTCCLLFSGEIRVRIRGSLWLVSGYAHVFILFYVVIVTLPLLSSLGMYKNHGKKSAKSRRGFEKMRKITEKSRRSIYCTVCTHKVTILLYIDN